MFKIALIQTFEFFILPLFAIFLFNVIFDFLIKKSIFSPFYMIIIAPGIVIHEISHAIVAIVTGAEIKHINFFSKSGGHVIHTQGKIPLISQFFISFAPVVGQIFFILLISYWATPHLFLMSWQNYSLYDIGKVFRELNWGNIGTWILIYIIISCCLSIAPSKKDLKNAFFSIIFVSTIIFYLFYSGLINNLLPYFEIIFPALWLAVLLILLITLFVLPFVMLNKVLGKW